MCWPTISCNIIIIIMTNITTAHRAKVYRKAAEAGRQEEGESPYNSLQMLPLSLSVCPSEGNFQSGTVVMDLCLSGVIILREIELLSTWKTSQRLSQCLCFPFCLWGPRKGVRQGLQETCLLTADCKLSSNNNVPSVDVPWTFKAAWNMKFCITMIMNYIYIMLFYGCPIPSNNNKKIRQISVMLSKTTLVL